MKTHIQNAAIVLLCALLVYLKLVSKNENLLLETFSDIVLVLMLLAFSEVIFLQVIMAPIRVILKTVEVIKSK